MWLGIGFWVIINCQCVRNWHIKSMRNCHHPTSVHIYRTTWRIVHGPKFCDLCSRSLDTGADFVTPSHTSGTLLSWAVTMVQRTWMGSVDSLHRYVTNTIVCCQLSDSDLVTLQFNSLLPYNYCPKLSVVKLKLQDDLWFELVFIWSKF
jgi:hypothetical protein